LLELANVDILLVLFPLCRSLRHNLLSVLILIRLWSVGLWRAETAAVVLSLAGVLLWLLITTLLLVAFVVVAASLVGSLRARLCIAIGLLGPERILVSAGGRRVAVLLFVEKAWFGSLESDRVLGS